MKLAIVGPQEDKWTEAQKASAKLFIETLFYQYRNWDGSLILVSGHCPKGGVDIWAEEIAKKLGLDMDIFTPDINQWEDKVEIERTFLKDVVLSGFKSRNIAIAKDCDVLYCIVPNAVNLFCNHCKEIGHPNNGGCWTMKYAHRIGKETHLEVI